MKISDKIKQFFTLLLAIFILVGLLPIKALAEGATSVTTEAALILVFQNGGNAILNSDITLSKPLEVLLGKTVNLDLNGKKIDRGLGNPDVKAEFYGNVITVNGSLTLNDSIGTGKITGGKKSGFTGGGGIYVAGTGALTMNGGSVSGNTTVGGSVDGSSFSGGYGGGVFVAEGGAFTMCGGAVSENRSFVGNGGGIYAEENSTLSMSGGSISGNKAAGFGGGGVFLEGSTFTMFNGSISGNTAEGNYGNGGGVAVDMGSDFTMNGGSINGNTAGSYGGGAYVFLGSVFTMNGGTVNGNSAVEGGGIYFDTTANLDYGVGTLAIIGGEISENTTDSSSFMPYGGGVYIAGGNVTISGGSKINRNKAVTGAGIFMLNGTCVMENSEICENTTIFKSGENHGGGGVYLASGSDFTMNSGKINKNTAIRGGGIFVFGGTFTMKNGQINENATSLDGMLCDGGGVYLNASGAFNMEGGEICSNTTTPWFMYNHGGGVFVYGGSFKVSGGAKILNNSREGVPNNVYLKTNDSIIKVAGSLTGLDGTIGVSTRVSDTPVTVAQGDDYTIGEADFKKFTHDTGGSLDLAESKITLLNPNASYLAVLSYNANGGSGSHGSSAIIEGMENEFTVASGAGFSRTNCSFAGWNTKADGSGDAYPADSKFVLTSTTILYAQWTIDKAELTVTAPNVGAAPSSTAACIPSGVTASLTWKQGTNNLIGSFDYNTVYSLEMTLTADSGSKFADIPEIIINGQPASIQSGSATAQTVTFTFSKTGPRSAPTANLSKTVINVANTGGNTPLTLNVSGIVDSYNSLTWTMSETDVSNILTIPSTTTGTLVDGALSLDSFTVAANAAGQPAKSASVTISFSGNENGEYAGVPTSVTVTFQLAEGNAPEAVLDFTNEKITGVSNEMEYLVDNYASKPVDWTGATTVTGTEIPLSGIIPAATSSSKYIHIRLKDIIDSTSKNIEIPARPDLVAFFDDTWDSWVTNNIWTDVETGGVYEGFGYRINSGPNMLNNSDDDLDIPLAPGDKLTFWKPATALSFKSAEITVTAPERLQTNVVIDFAGEKLNTRADIQYRMDEEDEWKPCTANMAATAFGWDSSAEVSVQLFCPYTDSNYASEVQILTIPTRPAPPVINCSSTATTISVTAETGVRYRLDGGEWKTADGNGKVAFTGLTANHSYTVDAQKSATESAFQSEAASLSVSTKSISDGIGSVSIASWKYGKPASEPSPVSATNGTNGVTYTYSGTKADGTVYNSSAKPTDAGIYTVTATFAATSDYKQVISEAASFTISKKEIEIQWKNLTAVYDGTSKSPVFTLIGVESGDSADVSAQLSESKTNTGSYSVSATLNGSRSFNYTLTNPIGTLLIQKTSVIFSISGDTSKYDGSSHTASVAATASGSNFTDFSVIYKNSKSETVLNPTDVGSYSIFALISDTNYRHADATDGAAKKIGVLTIYASSAPDTYTVSFSGGDGALGSMTPLVAAQAGTVRILPESTGITNGTKLFAGWKYSGKVYQPGEVLSQPASNISLTAVWTDYTYSVDGIVYKSVNPFPDAVVTLMQGSVQLAQTVTGTGGEYSFADVTPGIYNLVASKNGTTQTILLKIVQNNVTNLDILLPSGKTNSVVEVAAGSPAIVVGNLEQTFSNADKQAAGNGSTVEMKLNAKALDSSGVDQAAIDATAGGTVGLYLELNLTKTVTPVSGSPSTTNIKQSNVLLDIVVQIPGGLQGKDNYVVFRRHNGEIQTLTTAQNGSGEYITVNADKTAITIHAKLFSTYAIGYIAPASPGSGVNVSASADYTIEATAGDGGSISPSGTANVTKGSSKTYTITPENGYAISNVLVDGVSVGAVSSYTFSNITATHTIKAVFVKATGLPYYLDVGGNKVFLGFSSDSSGTMKYIAPLGKTIMFAQNPKNFTDIVDHWAKSGIDFVTQREIFQGTDSVTFSPNTGMTRGMFAAVIGRLYERSYGILATEGTAAFTDVSADAYYFAYINWAAKNGIVEGAGGGKFFPDRQITREEMALLLYRFAKFLKTSETETSGIKLSYLDTADISSWAIDGVKYCNEANLITGRDNGNFGPKETATRAEVATTLVRFIQSVV
ncbi:MAG: hypothetical protein CVU91_06060 [Firmicutes bacterium HGW-Firmicutes-16]|nr:MAG: hypothetical protein CVU91_06060 [Firmicutes bacterium HGW-Firmicutes-16]